MAKNATATKATTKANTTTSKKASTKTTTAPTPVPAAPPPEVKKAEAKKPTRGPTAKRIGRDVVKLERAARRLEVLESRREAWGSEYRGALRDARAALLKAVEVAQLVKVEPA